MLSGAIRSIPVRPPITSMLRWVASSKNASVETGELVVNAWQVVVPEARRLSKNFRVPSSAYARSLYFISSGNIHVRSQGSNCSPYAPSTRVCGTWTCPSMKPGKTKRSLICVVSTVDPTTRRVYVNDRAKGRLQWFDENGKFLDQWEFGPRPPIDIHSIYMGSDHVLWAADEGTNKLLSYHASGHFLYSWGTYGTCSGCMWGVR